MSLDHSNHAAIIASSSSSESSSSISAFSSSSSVTSSSNAAPTARQQQPPRRVVKYRSTCDNCHKRKVKCGQEKPACARCEGYGLQCIYGVSRRMGKPKGVVRAAAAAAAANAAASSAPPPPPGIPPSSCLASSTTRLYDYDDEYDESTTTTTGPASRQSPALSSSPLNTAVPRPQDRHGRMLDESLLAAECNELAGLTARTALQTLQGSLHAQHHHHHHHHHQQQEQEQQRSANPSVGGDPHEDCDTAFEDMDMDMADFLMGEFSPSDTPCTARTSPSIDLSFLAASTGDMQQQRARAQDFGMEHEVDLAPRDHHAADLDHDLDLVAPEPSPALLDYFGDKFMFLDLPPVAVAPARSTTAAVGGFGSPASPGLRPLVKASRPPSPLRRATSGTTTQAPTTATTRTATPSPRLHPRPAQRCKHNLFLLEKLMHIERTLAPHSPTSPLTTTTAFPAPQTHNQTQAQQDPTQLSFDLLSLASTTLPPPHQTSAILSCPACLAQPSALLTFALLTGKVLGLYEAFLDAYRRAASPPPVVGVGVEPGLRLGTYALSPGEQRKLLKVLLSSHLDCTRTLVGRLADAVEGLPPGEGEEGEGSGGGGGGVACRAAVEGLRGRLRAVCWDLDMFL